MCRSHFLLYSPCSFTYLLAAGSDSLCFFMTSRTMSCLGWPRRPAHLPPAAGLGSPCRHARLRLHHRLRLPVHAVHVRRLSRAPPEMPGPSRRPCAEPPGADTRRPPVAPLAPLPGLALPAAGARGWLEAEVAEGRRRVAVPPVTSGCFRVMDSIGRRDVVVVVVVAIAFSWLTCCWFRPVTAWAILAL